MHIAVIGAGISGAASALELAEAGHQVTLIEPNDPGGEHAASYGNGAWLSPASVVPMSMPGMWRKVPGYLLDPLGPLAIRPLALPKLLPWLVRFVIAGSTLARVERTARHLRALLEAAPVHHQALAAKAGVGHLIHRDGLLYAYRSRVDFEQDALAWKLRRDNGVAWSELEGSALRDFEPRLDPRYQFAAFVGEGGHCSNPGAYVAALVAAAAKRGARHVRARAKGFFVSGGRLRNVIVDGGEVACDRAVIAAGIRSAEIARSAGDRIPMAAERGYHVQLPMPGLKLRAPVLPADGKMAITMLDDVLRASGQVELCGTDEAPDWQRSEILRRFLPQVFPDVSGGMNDDNIRRWMGHRPSTPDGLPVIGPSAMTSDIVHAFGHGHVGLAAGAMTARLVMALVAGISPPIDPTPYSALRFG